MKYLSVRWAKTKSKLWLSWVQVLQRIEWIFPFKTNLSCHNSGKKLVVGLNQYILVINLHLANSVSFINHDTCVSMVGGHTAEMLSLLARLDHTQYSPRCFVVAATDKMGRSKAIAAEQFYSKQSTSDQVQGYAYFAQAIPLFHC